MCGDNAVPMDSVIMNSYNFVKILMPMVCSFVMPVCLACFGMVIIGKKRIGLII